MDRNGFDRFYAGQSYDLVMLNHVHPLPPPVFFRHLGKHIKPDGRIVVYSYQPFFIFFDSDFKDKQGLLKVFETQRMLEKLAEYCNKPAAHIKKEFSDNPAKVFTLLLYNPQLCSDFLKKGTVFGAAPFFSQEEREFVVYLISFLQAEMQAFDQAGGFLAFDDRGVARRIMKKLNKILLGKRFSEYLRRGIVNPYSNISNPKIENVFEEAGYILKEKRKHHSVRRRVCVHEKNGEREKEP